MDISALRERQGDGVFSVTDLNNYIKTLFEGNRTLSAVTVRAEISNFVSHRSGHLYFSVKDSETQMRAVMFRSSAASLKFLPANGMRLILHGSVSVYPRDGTYQLYVNSMQPDGVGALYLAYEQLKARLEAEGLFDFEAKKPIPKIPRAIGVVTSPSGAAVRDIINVITRRFPLARIYVYPATVQGEGAEDTLIRALDFFDRANLVDTVIIGRGGGSIEDLWAFNSERLARKIYSMGVPAISAVGHETDFTICDFVADLRAPTPSAAAELSVPDIKELFQALDYSLDRCSAALMRKVERLADRLKTVSESDIFYSPSLPFESKRETVIELANAASNALRERLRCYRTALSLSSEKANALSPLAVLSRGYSIVEKDGLSISDTNSIGEGDLINVRFSNGSAQAIIKSVKNGKSK